MSNYKLAVKRPVLKTHHFSQLKLPAFEKKHSQQQSKRLHKIKSGKLPHLIFQGDHSSSSLSQVYERSSSEVAVQLPYDIEERINNILQKNQVISHEYYNEESENFEANVQRNKEFLKLQREKRGSVLSKQHEDIGNREVDVRKKKSQGQRMETNQGKMETNKGKKVMSKLKFEGDSPHVKSRIEHISLREDSRLHLQSMDRGGKSSPGHRPVANRLEKKVKEMKNKISKRNKQQQRLHTDGEEGLSENLFDNIHNYLSNPHRDRHEPRVASSRSKIREKKQVLEEKLRDIQCRLSIQKNAGRANRTMEDTPPPIAGTQEVDCGVTWRRVQFKDSAGVKIPKKISVDASTFQREVSHLGNLQQRNEHSLQRYVQNQRLLNSLKMVRDKTNNHQLNRQFLSK